MSGGCGGCGGDAPWPADDVAVLKFGGSVLTGEGALATVVAEIAREVRVGRRVVVVCSAYARATDRLAAEARRIHPNPEPGALVALLASGEAHAAAAVALAVDRGGLPVTLLGVHQVGIEAEGPPLDAEPRWLEPPRLVQALAATPVVVVPGFVACTREGDLVLLGRGGSDLTALMVAAALGSARCRLLKSADGWYVSNPDLHRGGEPPPPRYRALHWADALAHPSGVVQKKALAFARRLGQNFEVAAPGSPFATRVGECATEIEAPSWHPGHHPGGVVSAGSPGSRTSSGWPE
jgi:homoserine dehydrogenase